MKDVNHGVICLTDNYVGEHFLKDTGFTLVELLIVVAVMAILVALALPNYQESIRKSRRSDAQSELMKFAGVAERVFTLNSSYATVDDDPDADNPNDDIIPDNTDFYTYSFVAAATASTYSIRAVPGGSQVTDACGTMTLTQAGVRTHTGSLTGCW